MNFIEASEAAFAGATVLRSGWAIPVGYAQVIDALVYEVPGPLSSRYYTPSCADIVATDWEIVNV